MRIDPEHFRVREHSHVKLKKCATTIPALYRSDAHLQELLREHISQLSDIQQVLYAANRYSLLVIFQGMDAAGKDSAIKHVMSGVNPQGCHVHSFKHPSSAELEHDFLWHATRFLPERGQIGIFNRSYYEEVLIVRVHPEILDGEGLGSDHSEQDQFWDGRYQSMVELEAHLSRNNTRIIKIFLHLSKEEQRKRFLARIDHPQKNWKFSKDDLTERGFWDDYMKTYELCLSSTSTAIAPWYIVPADDKENTHLIVSQIILDTLGSMHLSYPTPTAEREAELQSFRTCLAT